MDIFGDQQSLWAHHMNTPIVSNNNATRGKSAGLYRFNPVDMNAFVFKSSSSQMKINYNQQ